MSMQAVLPVLVLVGAAAASAWAAPPKSVEQLAQEIAQSFNQLHAAGMVEGATLSARAEAKDKQVVYIYTVKRQPPFSQDMLDRFKTEHDTVILGVSCSGHAKDEAFTTGGLSFATIFQDEQGRRLHELVVDQKACARL